MATKCVGFGSKVGTCESTAEPNRLWCSSCEHERVEHLCKGFSQLSKGSSQ